MSESCGGPQPKGQDTRSVEVGVTRWSPGSMLCSRRVLWGPSSLQVMCYLFVHNTAGEQVGVRLRGHFAALPGAAGGHG